MQDEIMKLLADPTYTKRSIQELAHALHQEKTDDFVSFVKIMNELEDQGKVIRNSHNHYYLLDQLSYFKGLLSVNKKGFGFVKVDQDREFYINERNIKDAFNGDTVLIEKIKSSKKGKEEARIVRVIERGSTRYVGEVKQGRKDLYVEVDDPKFNKKIFVDAAHSHGAMPGHKVVVEIKVFKPQLKGNIVKILGYKTDPGVDILSIIEAHDLEIDFPEEVYDYVEKNIPSEIDPSDLKNRVDLRNKLIVTIDGDDAKDLDDAISLKRLPHNHYELGVHIADVSFYVKEGSPLDRDAIKRGTSVYLVDRVIPMLPHKLCNGICSLNEGVDRYTISCMMEIDQNGQVVDHKIVPSVIRSTHRMTYHNVNRIIAGEDLPEYKDAYDLFFLMKEVAGILNKKRKKRGAIDFDTDEAVIHVDEKGHVSDITIRERGESEHFIEEFMLCANETVAEHFKWMDLPFIYRVHEEPKADKLQQFVTMARPLGYVIHGSLNHVNPHELARIAEESKGRPEHTVITTLLLRSMQKARYDAQCLGHFGLADEFYTHFTSPIRRYPDLLVHRLIRTFLFENRMDQISHFNEVIPELAEQSSIREKVANDTEFDVEDMKKAEFMEERIGETFEGVISSVTNFGFFVQLPNTIEGLVHMNTLDDDYYIFDEDHLMLIGEHTAKQYRLGDAVKVVCIDVNKTEMRVDFSVISSKENKRRKLDPRNDHRSHYHKKKKKYQSEKPSYSRENRKKRYNKKRRRR